jgi:putative methionine-R-sulfoxide reductase with GAF domain
MSKLWLALPQAVRWILLLSLFAVTCTGMVMLHWGSLPATPFYPLVLLAVVVGTEWQGYVLTVMSASASLMLAVLLPRSAPLSEAGVDTALLLLVSVTLIVAMHQRRAATRLTKVVVYETGVLRALGNYALTRLSRDEMLRAIVRYLANFTDASVAVVVMSDSKENCLTGYIDANGGGLGPRPVERTIADSIAGHIFSSNQAKNVPDTAKDPDFMPVPTLTIGSLIGVPLRLAGQPIGVIVVGKQQANGFTQDDVRLLETLARTISVPLYASRPAAQDRASTAS